MTIKSLSIERNFLGLPSEHSDPETAGVIVLPVPFESTSTYGKGSWAGPEAILEASHQVELFDCALGCEPFVQAGGIATLEPLNVLGCNGPEVALRIEEAVNPWIARGKFVVVLGGEHTSIIGNVRAHCAVFNDVTVIQFDAHSDLRPEYEESEWNHACAMARLLDFHDSLVQVGIRSQEAGERALVEARSIVNLYAHDVHAMERQGKDYAGRIVEACRPRVYLTFDCDALDPSIIPATGTPEPGGLTWYQVDEILGRLCREREVIGMDFNELAPIEGSSVSQFTIAKLIYRMIGYRFSSNCRGCGA